MQPPAQRPSVFHQVPYDVRGWGTGNFGPKADVRRSLLSRSMHWHMLRATAASVFINIERAAGETTVTSAVASGSTDPVFGGKNGEGFVQHYLTLKGIQHRHRAANASAVRIRLTADEERRLCAIFLAAAHMEQDRGVETVNAPLVGFALRPAALYQLKNFVAYIDGHNQHLGLCSFRTFISVVMFAHQHPSLPPPRKRKRAMQAAVGGGTPTPTPTPLALRTFPPDQVVPWLLRKIWRFWGVNFWGDIDWNSKKLVLADFSNAVNTAVNFNLQIDDNSSTPPQLRTYQLTKEEWDVVKQWLSSMNRMLTVTDIGKLAAPRPDPKYLLETVDGVVAPPSVSNRRSRTYSKKEVPK